MKTIFVAKLTAKLKYPLLRWQGIYNDQRQLRVSVLCLPSSIVTSKLPHVRHLMTAGHHNAHTMFAVHCRRETAKDDAYTLTNTQIHTQARTHKSKQHARVAIYSYMRWRVTRIIGSVISSSSYRYCIYWRYTAANITAPDVFILLTMCHCANGRKSHYDLWKFNNLIDANA